MRKWDLVLTPPNCLRPPHRVYRRRRVFPAPLVQHDELRHVELAAAEVTGAPCSYSCAQTTSSNKGGNRCYNTSFSQCIPKNGCPAHTHPQGLHQVCYVRVLLPQNVNTRDFWISLSSYFFHELGRKDDSRRDSNGTTATSSICARIAAAGSFPHPTAFGASYGIIRFSFKSCALSRRWNTKSEDDPGEGDSRPPWSG